MEFQEVVTRRRTVRRFTDETVSGQSLQRLLRNAVRGPSAGFSQGQSFIVLRGEELSQFWLVAGLADHPATENVPLLIIPLVCKRAYLDRYAELDKGETDRDESRWPAPFWYIDTGMATTR